MNQTADARSGPSIFAFNLSSFFRILFAPLLTRSRERNKPTKLPVYSFESVNPFLLTRPVEIELISNNKKFKPFKPIGSKIRDDGTIYFKSSSQDINSVIVFENGKQTISLPIAKFTRKQI